MRSSRNVIVTEAGGGEARGYIDGAGTALPIQVVPRQQIDFEEVAKAELTLAWASTLHEAGDHRNAFLAAVRSARELFSAIGTTGEMHEPLRHLFDAIQGLDRGAVDPALQQSVENRRQESTSEWNARASLVVAMEARLRSGDQEGKAADAIRAKVAIIAGKPTAERGTATKRLIGWRKQFRSSLPPPEGLVLYQTGVEMIDKQTAALKGSVLATVLTQLEEKAILMAKQYRHREGN